MRVMFYSTVTLFGLIFQVLGDPDAGPGPSPIADPGRKPPAEKPAITRQPMDKVVIRGQTARMHCSAKGYPSPQISWLKDGSPFREEAGDGFVLPLGEIMFYHVRTHDGGVYQCVVKNSAGVVRSRNATLQIAYIKEDFRSIPQDNVAAVGGTAELRCEGPNGVPEPKISWKKNERKLSINGGRVKLEKGKLIISGATKADSGQYQCVAENDAGTRTSVSVLLSVHEPPVFTVKPEDQTVVSGDTLELTCEAKGDPKPRIRWTKPSGVESSRVVSLSNGNLRITDVQPGDGGKYDCSAGNRVAQILASATVTVTSKARFIRQPKDVTGRVGTTVSIPCWAEGEPKPTISWHHIDGETNMFPGDAYEGGHIVVQTNGDLTFKNVQFSDQGQYVCEVYHPNGPLSAKAQLKVTSRKSNANPPVIRQGPQNVTVAQGSELQIECTSSSIPVPELKWNKDGSGDIRSGNRFTVTMSGSLTIENVQNSDSGRYTCTATSDYGWSKWDVWIKVVARGTPISPTNDDVTHLPSSPGVPIFVNATSTSITLQWSPSSDAGSSPFTGYVLEYYCLESELPTWNRVKDVISARTYTVRGLQPAANCVFLVRTQNRHGTSDPSQVSDPCKTLDKDQPSTGDTDLQRMISQISVRITKADPLTTAASSVGIHLDWDSSAHCYVIDGFKIYAQPVSIQNGRKIVKTTECYASNINLENLQSRVVYEIRIHPYKGDVVGRSSPIVLASPESEGTSPELPTLEVDTKIEDEDLAIGVFKWTPPASIRPEYITRYTLRCHDKSSATGSFKVTEHVNGSVTTLTLTGLPRGREYAAYLSYDTLLGEGLTSDAREFTIAATSAPSGLAGMLSKPGVLAGIAACIVLVIGIVAGVFVYRKRKRSKKGRGLHGRARIPFDSFSRSQYPKDFTMSLTNTPGGNNNYSDGTGSSSGNPNGNILLGGMNAPHSVARHTNASLNNSNGNIGISLSPDTRSTARHGGSFSYVTDQLTSMSNIQPQFSSPLLERTPTQVMSATDLQLQIRQQQLQHQAAEYHTLLAGDFSPHSDLIDMDTPTKDERLQDNNLPPPPPSPPTSQKTSLSDKTNRSRGSSRNSAERGSNHSKGRRSRERNRGFQPIERAPTDTDTGIDSPQQTPSPPRPSDLRAEHPSGLASQSRGPASYSYGSKQQGHSSRRRNDGLAVGYGRNGDSTSLGYLAGPSECDTEPEADVRRGRSNYIPPPEEVRNSVTASSVSMMNRYDSESVCSDRSPSPVSSIESLNMESASQVGVNDSQHASASAFAPVQPQYNGGYVKPKVPKKPHDRPPLSNVHYAADPPAKNGGQEQFFNRVNSSASSSGSSSSYRHNTADSGMSAGGQNSLNSSSSVGSNKQMCRSRTTGSLTPAETQPNVGLAENGQTSRFASVDRKHPPDSGSRFSAPQQRHAPEMDSRNKIRPRIHSPDSKLSLPSRNGTAYVDHSVNDTHDTEPMLPGDEYRMNENDVTPVDESKTAFLASKSVFAGGVAPKLALGRHPELSDVPEVSTSDFCEDYSDRSQ